jgi:hypothetical protein
MTAAVKRNTCTMGMGKAKIKAETPAVYTPRTLPKLRLLFKIMSPPRRPSKSNGAGCCRVLVTLQMPLFGSVIAVVVLWGCNKKTTATMNTQK